MLSECQDGPINALGTVNRRLDGGQDQDDAICGFLERPGNLVGA